MYQQYYILGYYECHCPPQRNGKNCQIYDPDFEGGIGTEGPPIPVEPTTSKPLTEQQQECIKNSCVEKGHNGVCDVSKSMTQDVGPSQDVGPTQTR